MKSVMLGMLATLLVAAIGCEKESAQPQAQTEALPADLFVTAAPDGAVDIIEVKKSLKDGDSVVIKGVVAGQKEPMSANRALMTVADVSLKTCDKIPGDTCATPWDACCEPGDVIAAASLPVQVVGADGQPLKAGLASGGLKPLKQVVVAGTAKSVGGALVIQAKQIYVAP